MKAPQATLRLAPTLILVCLIALAASVQARAETLCDTILHRETFVTLLGGSRERMLAVTQDRVALQKRQQHSVKATLATHGTESSIQEQSRINLDRITAELGPNQPLSEELEAQLSAVRFDFIHNTHVLSENPDTPLLSTAALLELGLPGGLNTHWFNREFLRSHDQLFFHVQSKLDGTKTQAMVSAYGSYGLRPKREYAIQRGWLSPYVMVPGNLVRFAAAAAPDLGALLAEKLAIDPDIQLEKQRYGRKPLIAFGFLSLQAQDAWVRREEPIFREIMKRLHLLDFTVTDFEELARRLVRRRIHKHLSGEVVERYADPAEVLLKGPPDSVRLLIESTVTGYLDVSFEFKIPVALPADELQ